MDSQEKLTILKNIKSLHFDPSKLEPLKQNLFRSAIELEIKVYVALSTLVFLKRSCSLDWKKASFPRYLSFFFSFLEGYYFAFANIFVVSVLKSYIG